MADHVSRETPPTPDEARGAFPPERLALAERYAGWLADAGVVRGLIGPREAPRLWSQAPGQLRRLAAELPPDARVCDLGSGAGLPGLVLAICRPDVEVTLVEPLLRRTTFLEEVVADLGLDRVTVHRGRAESLHGVASFDVVTSRALAPLDRLLDWSMPLVAPARSGAGHEGRACRVTRSRRPTHLCDGGVWHRPTVLQVGEGLSTATVVRVTWADPAAVSWPITPEHEPERRPRQRSSRTHRRRP